MSYVEEITVRGDALVHLIEALVEQKNVSLLAEACVQDALMACIGERESLAKKANGMAILDVEVGKAGLVIVSEGLSDIEAEKVGRRASEAFLGLMKRGS